MSLGLTNQASLLAAAAREAGVPVEMPQAAADVVGALRRMGYELAPLAGDLSPRRAELLAAVRAEPGLPPRRYAAKLGISRAAVDATARALKERGLMRVEGLRRAARYFPVAEPYTNARSRERNEPPRTISALKLAVVDLIRENDGVLDEDGLAYGTRCSRDNVAEACGRLLVEGVLVLSPDGTYRLP